MFKGGTVKEKKKKLHQTKKNKGAKKKSTEDKHLEDLLDEGIDESFPASDPVAVTRRKE